VEISRSGITRMRALKALPFPMMNIDGGRLKPAVENRHGVGEGLWQAFTELTGMHLAGHRVSVIGYGPVGTGVAHYARSGGAVVEVLEKEPVRRLIAHYDGFITPSSMDMVRRAQVIVTATGTPKSLPFAVLNDARDGVVLINAGHTDDEIDIPMLRREAQGVDQVGAHVVRYRLANGRHLVVLADGHPLNIVLNAGSQEPVLLHFAVLGLGLEWLAKHDREPGEILVPAEIEDEAARVALSVVG